MRAVSRPYGSAFLFAMPNPPTGAMAGYLLVPRAFVAKALLGAFITNYRVTSHHSISTTNGRSAPDREDVLG